MRPVLNELWDKLHHVASKAIGVLPQANLGRHNTILSTEGRIIFFYTPETKK